MRLGALILSIMLLSSLVFAQTHYLVSGRGDVVPMQKGQSAQQLINQYMKSRQPSSATTDNCPASQVYGQSPDWITAQGANPYDNGFVFGHKDVVANWFTAPASGRIDSVFFAVTPAAADSASNFPHFLYVRIFKSNVWETQGPGNDGYTAPPRICWGYFNSVWDDDNGIAAFPNETPDSAWVSAYNLNNQVYTLTTTAGNSYLWSGIGDHYGEVADTSLKSYPPGGDVIWGETGVQMNNLHRGVNFLALSKLVQGPDVNVGDHFFVTFKNPGIHPPGYTQVGADPTRVTIQISYMGTLGGDPDLGEGSPRDTDRVKFHDWKFYEHKSFCGVGWLARGGFMFNIWYTMSVTSDIPPTFLSIQSLGHTTNTIADRPITIQAADCNFANPLEAGIPIGGVTMFYSVDDGPAVAQVMSEGGGAYYTSSIPHQACGHTVTYWFSATDIKGNVNSGYYHSYRVVCLNSKFYAADVNGARSTSSISPSHGGSGTPIDTSEFFLPPTYNGRPQGKYDDGTAGPYALSTPFTYFGKSYGYAWVGINGAISLSETAADTMHCSLNGAWGHMDIPYPERRHVTADSEIYVGGVPRNFIGGLWSDLIYADSNGVQYGAMYRSDDSHKFIVEWDSLGSFDSTNAFSADEVTFRFILNKDDGSLEFQYDDLGLYQTNRRNTVAIQSDTLDPAHYGYFWLEDYGYPSEIAPHAGGTIKLYPAAAIAIADGWNMVSSPAIPVDNHRTALFPTGLNRAFYYSGSYQPVDTLNPGWGYWLKFSGAQTINVGGGLNKSLDVPLQVRWNMIGSLSHSIPVTSLTTGGLAVINTSSIYKYSGGYNTTPTIDPGSAYWVKNTGSGAGTLHMAFTGASPKATVAEEYAKMNQITVGSGSAHQSLYIANSQILKQSMDAYELPPMPPTGSFDARFTSDRMVEAFDANTDVQYAIKIQASQYPVTVSWNMAGGAPDGRTFTMTDGNNGKVLGKMILNGTGSIKISDNTVTTLIIRAESGISIPKSFGLSHNYPNPFNPTTYMHVDMPRTTNVVVAVYDVLGRNIATLLQGTQSAGSHVIQWNGLNNQGMPMPSGTYFVRMTADEFSAVQKIMMMK